MPISLKLATACLALWPFAVFASVTAIAVLQVLLGVGVLWGGRELWRARLPWSAWALGLFALACILASAVNHADLIDAAKNWGRFKYQVTAIFAFGLFRPWWTSAPVAVRLRVFQLGLGIFILSCLYGVGTYLWRDQDRLRGLTDTLRFGYGIGFVLVALLALWPVVRAHMPRTTRILFFVAYGLGLSALLLAATRGALLGWLCGIVVVGLCSGQAWLKRAASAALAVLLTMVAVYFLAPASWDVKLIGTRHRASDGVRFAQWGTALKAIKEKPLLGHGPANVAPQLDRIKTAENHRFAWYSSHSHNTFLEVIAGTGAVGLVCFLAWLALWMREGHLAGGVQRGLAWGAAGYLLVAGQFEVMLDANNSTLIFLLWAVCSASAPVLLRAPVLAKHRMSSLVTAAVFFLLVGTFTSVTVQGGFQVLFTVALVYYTWLARGRSFKLPASAWWLLLFALVGLVSILWSWEDVLNHSKNLGRLKYYVYGALGIFPVGVWVSKVSHRTLRRLGRWFFAAVIVSGAWNIWQILQGAARAEPLTETMRYAYGTTLVCVLMLGLLFHREKVKSWFDARWALLALVFGLLGMYFTYSRGAQGALILVLPLVCWFRRPAWGVVSGVIVAALLGFLVQNYFHGAPAEASHRLLDGKNNASDQIRRSQWQAAVIAIKERPVLGWGLGNFHSQLRRIKVENQLAHPEYNDAHAHNVLLEIAAGTGLLGLAVFVTWFLTWAWEMWRAGGLRREIFLPFFAAIAFEAQFEVILDANNATMIFFIYALSQGLNRRWQMPFG